MKHSLSVSELQTVCSVHVANDPSQIVFIHYVRDSGVVSVEVLDSQLPKHWGSVILRLQSGQRGCTERSSLPLEGLSNSIIHPD